jgi:hypothetical protein
MDTLACPYCRFAKCGRSVLQPFRPTVTFGCLEELKMELTHNEKQTLVLALGRAIEPENRALENCVRLANPTEISRDKTTANVRPGEIDKAIAARKRVVQELEDLRTRLTS